MISSALKKKLHKIYISTKMKKTYRSELHSPEWRDGHSFSDRVYAVYVRQTETGNWIMANKSWQLSAKKAIASYNLSRESKYSPLEEIEWCIVARLMNITETVYKPGTLLFQSLLD